MTGEVIYLTMKLNRRCFFLAGILMYILLVSPVNADQLILHEYAEPLLQVKPAEKLLVNGTGIYLTTGDSWEFYQGYILTVKSVNADKRQVWIKLLNGDELVKEGIVSEGELFVYSKDDGAQILNLTLDTIYINSAGELVTFKPVYQYMDYDLPEPVIEDREDNTSIIDDDNESRVITITGRTDGFTLAQAVACLTVLMTYRRFFTRK